MSEGLSALDPSWLEWLCEALSAGVDEEQLCALLSARGDPNPQHTLQRLERDPIFKWALHKLSAERHIAQRATRFLELQSASWALRDQPLPRLERPTAERFFEDFYCAGRPLVITNWATQWPALELWSPTRWSERFRGLELEICSGRSADPLYDRRFEQLSQVVDFGEFAAEIASSSGPSNDRYLIARNFAFERPELSSLLDELDEEPYLNPQRRAGSVALWFGPEGTYTPLHHDTCHIMFVQIYGQKRVTLIPAHAQELFDEATNMYSNISPERDLSLEPAHPQQLELTLSPGEALFIPVGWWHAVRSLSPSISVAMTHFKRSNRFAWYQPNALNRAQS